MMLAATDWNPLIVSLSVSVPTILGLVAAYFDLRRKAMEQKKDIADVKDDVRKIEVATNSMKDALVRATREEALLRGAANERTRVSAEEGVRAQGASDERTRADSSREDPNLVVKNGRVVTDDAKETQIVVDIKGKPPIVPDEEK